MGKGIIFDLDGTLLYTLVDLREAVNYTMRQYGFQEITLEDTRKYVGNGVRNLIAKASKQENNIEAMYATYKTFYDVHKADHIEVYDGIYELLKTLKEKGYKMAVVSNKYQESTEALCKPLFDKYIDVFIGSRDNVKNKPDRALVDIALKELGLKSEEACYVGDSETDILTARNADMKCISVTYGYRDEEVLKDLKPDYLVHSPLEILKILGE